MCRLYNTEQHTVCDKILSVCVPDSSNGAHENYGMRRGGREREGERERSPPPSCPPPDPEAGNAGTFSGKGRVPHLSPLLPCLSMNDEKVECDFGLRPPSCRSGAHTHTHTHARIQGQYIQPVFVAFPEV